MASLTDVLPPRYAGARLIASGGMGRVFHATDSELRRDVAVKMLADRYADNEDVRARFRREALAAARLSGNPNIVTIFDVGEYQGRPLIVMEYLDGGSLAERVHGQGGCPPAQVLAWLEQAAHALDAAHAAGVVHRDIKPGNLLLDRRDQVHVGDFGIASAVGLDSFTETGTILGTAGYLSPEQAQGERATAASDRYSLAVVAYELLAGRRPFESESTTAEAARHATAPVPSIHSEKPELAAAFDTVFQRGLAKEPAARYPSAAEFVADLRAALHEDAGTTAWIFPRQPMPTAVTQVAPPAPVSHPPPSRTTQAPVSRRWLLPLLFLLLIGVGVAVALAATRSSAPRSATGKRRPVTILRTVTQPGTTIEQTVTAPPPPPVTTAAAGLPASTQVAAPSGAALNLEGYAKMRTGDYHGALPLLSHAVQQLTGTGSLDEAYADYNLAYTRYELGQCTDVLPLLDHSQAIQGRRTEIDALRRDAQKACG
jgi:eukaryotic-like serine/threonine-protein kinase